PQPALRTRTALCPFEERWVSDGPSRCLLREGSWPLDYRHGNWKVGSLFDVPEAPLRFLMRAADGLPVHPEGFLFLDTETTGLAGGTGTFAFLIGCAFLQRDRFVTRHYFAPDFSAELVMMREVAGLLEQFPCLVTFNGKSYDLPLLQTRFTLQRRVLDIPKWRQVDLLHIARILWRGLFEHCTLATLEREILGFRRREHLPSGRIPQVYFDFIRHGRLDTMQGVFDHNAWDLLTCASLLGGIAKLMSTPSSAGDGSYAPGNHDGGTPWLPAFLSETGPRRSTAALDRVRLARLYWSRGEVPLALRHCQAASDPAGLELEGIIHKKLKDPEVWRIWEALIRRPDYRRLRAFWELSLYAEHKEGNPRRALRLLDQWRNHSGKASAQEARRVELRKLRLARKIERQTACFTGIATKSAGRRRLFSA
ncbi:MAG: ribonuclease H-like domain-containing protein, partial [Acidobacteria bacterium]|nr:ribonuclease H-like domain-containing protein [Acidobacteriota bacterium]